MLMHDAECDSITNRMCGEAVSQLMIVCCDTACSLNLPVRPVVSSAHSTDVGLVDGVAVRQLFLEPSRQTGSGQCPLHRCGVG